MIYNKALKQRGSESSGISAYPGRIGFVSNYQLKYLDNQNSLDLGAVLLPTVTQLARKRQW